MKKVYIAVIIIQNPIIYIVIIQNKSTQLRNKTERNKIVYVWSTSNLSHHLSMNTVSWTVCPIHFELISL